MPAAFPLPERLSGEAHLKENEGRRGSASRSRSDAATPRACPMFVQDSGFKLFQQLGASGKPEVLLAVSQHSDPLQNVRQKQPDLRFWSSAGASSSRRRGRPIRTFQYFSEVLHVTSVA